MDDDRKKFGAFRFQFGSVVDDGPGEFVSSSCGGRLCKGWKVNWSRLRFVGKKLGAG